MSNDVLTDLFAYFGSSNSISQRLYAGSWPLSQNNPRRGDQVDVKLITFQINGHGWKLLFCNVLHFIVRRNKSRSDTRDKKNMKQVQLCRKSIILDGGQLYSHFVRDNVQQASHYQCRIGTKYILNIKYFRSPAPELANN